MSNHPIEQDELMAYLDGELAARRAAEAASHLKQCPECQKLASDLQEVSEMMVAWQLDVEGTEMELGDEATAALNAPQPEARSARGRERVTPLSFVSGRRLVWGVGLAALVLLVLAVSIPNVLRSRNAANESAELARLRGQAELTRSRNQDSISSISGLATLQSNPSAPPKTQARQPDVGSTGRLTRDEEKRESDDNQDDQETPETLPGNAPMIIRTADLGVVVKEFEKARGSVEEILKRHHGHVGELSVNNPTGAARSLSGTLRIPSNQLDAALNDLKALGRVDKESHGGEEVTQQYVDLEARLANAKHTEQRLIEIQATRTGKLSDVLAVEVQIGRVRGEIERMEAERKNMKNQVDFATLNLMVVEDYKADLKVGPPSTGTQFRNAAVDGLESLTNGIIAVLLWLLSVGPTLLLWVAILFFPVRGLWRKVRPRLTASK
jgi:hypothetical protein